MSVQDNAAGRACGSCMMCCKVLPLAELDKPAGKWCVNARAGVGCVIHDTRPLACRTFACSWLSSPSLGDEWKPDRARFVLSVEANGALRVTCDPAQPTAWRREPYHTQIRQWSEQGAAMQKPLLLVVGDRVTVIMPNSEIEVGVLKAGDQVDLFHDGQRFHASVRKADG